MVREGRVPMLSQVKDHLDTMVNMTHPSGAGTGPMGSPMSGMWQ